MWKLCSSVLSQCRQHWMLLQLKAKIFIIKKQVGNILFYKLKGANIKFRDLNVVKWWWGYKWVQLLRVSFAVFFLNVFLQTFHFLHQHRLSDLRFFDQILIGRKCFIFSEDDCMWNYLRRNTLYKIYSVFVDVHHVTSDRCWNMFVLLVVWLILW